MMSMKFWMIIMMPIFITWTVMPLTYKPKQTKPFSRALHLSGQQWKIFCTQMPMPYGTSYLMKLRLLSLVCTNPPTSIQPIYMRSVLLILSKPISMNYSWRVSMTLIIPHPYLRVTMWTMHPLLVIMVMNSLPTCLNS